MKKILTLQIAFMILFTGCAAGMFGGNTIEGKILIKGHLPHSYVALKVNSRKYYNLVGPLSRVLRSSYRGKKVVLSGRIVAKAIGLGMPARFEVTKIVKVISR